MTLTYWQMFFCISVGAVGILWFFLWFMVGFSSPASHPRISTAERDFIEKSIGTTHGTQEKVTAVLMTAYAWF